MSYPTLPLGPLGPFGPFSLFSARPAALFGLLIILLTGGCSMSSEKPTSKQPGQSSKETTRSSADDSNSGGAGTAVATFGSGCFWCTEAVFLQLKGVTSVVSGYSGGAVENPTYDQVCSGTTGHAEVIQVTFDPQVVGYPELLEVFWKTHDPTTLNRQGNDVGTQYRSVVFYHDDTQRELAEHYKDKLNKSGIFDSPIVTEISAFTKFYAAEDYHQNYYAQNKWQPYCTYIIGPKLDKLRQVFGEKLK
jgi:peptide-methionine (S)-S-oxide reductase